MGSALGKENGLHEEFDRRKRLAERANERVPGTLTTDRPGGGARRRAIEPPADVKER